MADIFISYAKKDRKRVEPLANTLEKQGWTVWWDPIIPTGKDFDDVIEEELSVARCIIVIWTKRSVKSKYVKGEAREALNRDILVPIEIESGIKPPFDFRSTQTLSLINWDGSDKFPSFQKLIDDVTDIISKSPDNEQAVREAAESKLKAEEERRPEEVKEETKLDTPEPAKVKPPELKLEAKATTAPKPPEPSKKSNVVKFGAVAGVIVLVIVGIWLYISKPTSLPKTFKNSIGMKFVLIPAGTFKMGSKLSPEEVAQKYGDGGEASWLKNERPWHSVEITKPFYLQTTEVTQGQWRRVMRGNPSDFKDCGDDCPVERVTWDDVQEFIERLNQKKEGAGKYRLPTEAEWEYACRAETTTEFSFGDDLSELEKYAWYFANSKNQTHPGGTREPNPWGLYDMHGNVLEWCQDWYDENYYKISPWENPLGPQTGVDRVIRGGHWGDLALYCRSANRLLESPGIREKAIGFRLARSAALVP